MKKSVLTCLSVATPLSVLANMNGGLHINPWIIFVILFVIPVFFLSNIVLAIGNVSWKRQWMTVYTGISSFVIALGAIWVFTFSTVIGFALSCVVIGLLLLTRKSFR